MSAAAIQEVVCVTVCAVCGAARYSDGTEGSHQSFCAELGKIYYRMPPADRERMDNVPHGITHRRLLELWDIVDRRARDGTQQRLDLELAQEAAAEARRRDEVFIKRASKGAFGENARLALEETVRQTGPGTSRDVFLKAAKAAIEAARRSG
jgi:hypothetical protein